MLPRITAPQTPNAIPALPDPGTAGNTSWRQRPQNEAAESGELPAPLGLAAAQILGLALALSAALVALLGPAGLARQPRPPSDGRMGGVGKRRG